MPTLRAFRLAKIDVDRLDPATAGARIAHRPGSVARALIAALDHWTGVRRDRRTQASDGMKLVAVARAADSDTDRDALRAALLVTDRSGRLNRLRQLAARARVDSWAPASLVLLGNSLAGAGDVAAGVAVLQRASGAYPSDARVHYDLGRLLERLQPPRPEDAIRAYAAARAAQPETAHELAHALDKRGRDGEAERIFRDLTLRRPSNARHLACYGEHLKKHGQSQEAAVVLDRAIAAGRATIRLKPDDPDAHSHLGNALSTQGRTEEAIAEYRTAIGLGAGGADVHQNLGQALSRHGELGEMIAEYREAIRLDPHLTTAHLNLGAFFCDVKHDYLARKPPSARQSVSSPTSPPPT